VNSSCLDGSCATSVTARAREFGATVWEVPPVVPSAPRLAMAPVNSVGGRHVLAAVPPHDTVKAQPVDGSGITGRPLFGIDQPVRRIRQCGSWVTRDRRHPDPGDRVYQAVGQFLPTFLQGAYIRSDRTLSVGTHL
jgi:hypothetical protein